MINHNIQNIILFITLSLLASMNDGFGQDATSDGFVPIKGHVVQGLQINNDTLLHVYLPEVIILPPFHFNSEKQRQRYSRLVRYVKKVYPYAVLIRETYNEVNQHLDSLPNERERKKYVKQKEDELRKQFENELVKLTILQGRILIKLVDRETDHTTYEVLRDFRGPVSAFFWQSVARIFGSNLKSEYDAGGDDEMIEDIIIRIENGQL